MTSANTNPTTGLLVVEGQSDEHVVLHLCRRVSPELGAKFSLRDAKGLSGLLNSVRGYVNQQDLSAVGFLVDSDSDPLERWQEVTDRIITANSEIQVPQAPDANGTIITENPDIGSPRIGIWLMPDNSSEGEIEDFIAQMIPAADPVWPLSRDYIDGIPEPDRKFEIGKFTKAQVHAWLAARKFPGLMGVAIRERDLDVDKAPTMMFMSWLTRLFN